tara:strand:- start:665 stop:1483 length:819 start_codon:yes stop_codon:yes gene_type:complete
MDFNTFLDKLETVLDCKDHGYIKCLEICEDSKKRFVEYLDNLETALGCKNEGYYNCFKMVETMKKDNEKLKEENQNYEERDDTIEDAFASLNFYQEQCQELKDERKKLKEENEKLKEELADHKDWKAIARKKTEALQECFPQYNPAFQCCDDKEMIISMIKKLNEENGNLKNTLGLSDIFLEQYINKKLEEDEINQIEIPDKYFSEFLKPHFRKHIDTILKRMTTYESHGYGCYENGYWYDENLSQYELQHNGEGTICITRVEEEEEDEDVD